LQAHRKWWECIEGCNSVFRSLHAFHDHLANEHDVPTNNDRTIDLVRNCERQEAMSAEADCELCGVRLPTLTQLRRHLGKHQEELSLFALPSYMKEDDEEVDEDDVEIDSVASVANSEGSLSPAQITCEHCSLSIDDDHDGQVALHLHIQNVHGQSKTRVSSIDETDSRFVKAKELLREKPSVVQATDEQIFDETLIHHYLRLYLPEDVNTWKQLKDWAAEYTSDLDQEQILVLQAIQFQTMVDQGHNAHRSYYSDDDVVSIQKEKASLDTVPRHDWLPTEVEPVKEHSRPSDGSLIDERQEMWQCTFCYQHLAPESWCRHEETQHYPKYRWTCLATGPRLRQTDGSSMCAFCQRKDPDEDHLLSSHRIQDCSAKTEDERTFLRPDHLQQHVRNFHKSSLSDQGRDRWRRDGRKENEWWMCGFCNEKLTAWDMRQTHIAGHFKEGFTMASWQSFRTLDNPSTLEVLPGTLGKDSMPPSPSIQDDMPHRSLSLSAQDVDMLSANLKHEVIATEAQFDGAPGLRPDIWTRVQLSGTTLTFWNSTEDGVLKNQWRVQYTELQTVSLHEDHIHLRGLLQAPDNLPELKDFTMTFHEKSKAEFICAELTRAMVHNAVCPNDAELVLDDDLKYTPEYADIKMSCRPRVQWAGFIGTSISLKLGHEELSFCSQTSSQMKLQMTYNSMSLINVTEQEVVVKGVLGTYRRTYLEADSINKICVVTLEAEDEAQAEEIARILKERDVPIARSGWTTPEDVPSSPVAPGAPLMGFGDFIDRRRHQRRRQSSENYPFSVFNDSEESL
jgi:hypothetical protein